VRNPMVKARDAGTTPALGRVGEIKTKGMTRINQTT
jgi:hypothetical protein